MKKFTKITLAFIASILIVFAMGYFAIAFYEFNLDIEEWGKMKRGALLSVIACFLCFSPLIWMYLNDNI